jgi:nitrogen fixation NifU-like protein
MNAIDIHGDDELRELYRELILDHARSPRHFGTPAGATHSATGVNPLCGDKLRLYLCIDGDRIRDAGFEGSGCAISVASASLLTDTVIGLSTDEAMAYFEAVTGRLTGDAVAAPATDDTGSDKLRALDGVRDFPSRVKCATLAWRALDAAIHEQHDPVSTE